MKRTFRSLIKRVTENQAGFTLIEMIVVVGIIAVLAAVIVPNMGKFIGQGEKGAKSAEMDSVQTAMHAMMADKAITAVTSYNLSTTSSATNAWTGLPAGTDANALNTYLQSDNTKYFYCYDGTGGVTEQFETAIACTK